MYKQRNIDCTLNVFNIKPIDINQQHFIKVVFGVRKLLNTEIQCKTMGRNFPFKNSL